MRISPSFFALLLAGLLAVPPAQAQESTRIGLGVGLTPTSLNAVDIEQLFSPIALYVPVITPAFRLEPEVGLLRGSSSSDEFEETITLFHLGSGLFLNRSVDANTMLYGGVRLGVLLISESIEGDFGDEEESQTNFFVGPGAGGEYFFSDHFSLGGEVQVLYTSLDTDDEDDVSYLRNRALLFVRWYF